MSISIEKLVKVSLRETPARIGELNPNNILITSSQAPLSPNDNGYKEYRVDILPEIKKDFGLGSAIYGIAEVLSNTAINPIGINGSLYVAWQVSVLAKKAEIAGTLALDLTTLTASNYRIKIKGIETVDIDLSSATTKSGALAAINAALSGYSIAESSTANKFILSTTANGSSASITVEVPSSGIDLLALLGISGNALGADAINDANLLDSVKRVSKIADFIGFSCDTVGALSLDAARWASSNNHIFFWPTADKSDSQVATATSESLKNYQPFYGDYPLVAKQCCGYMGVVHGANTRISGSALTPFGKELSGVAPSASIKDSDFETLKNNKMSYYVAIGKGDNTVNKIINNKSGGWADVEWLLIWLESIVKTSILNTLTSTNSKISQTEQGMLLLKNSVKREVIRVLNFGAIAPGNWESSNYVNTMSKTTESIQEKGFYIFSRPISEQSQEDKDNRQAVPIEIAIKLSGAMHSAEVVINFTA